MDVGFDMAPVWRVGNPRGPKPSPAIAARNAEIVARVLAGERPLAIAKSMGLPDHMVRRVIRDARNAGTAIPNLRFGSSRKEPHFLSRDAEITRLATQGMTLEAIGQVYGITRERVRQICKRAGIPVTERGFRLKAKMRRTAAKDRRDARYLAKYGVDYTQLQTLRSIGATAAYIQQRNAQHGHYGIPWELSLRDWWLVWHESGKWEERGRGRYGMSCYDRAKGFVPGNVFIGTLGECIRHARKHKAAQCAN